MKRVTRNGLIAVAAASGAMAVTGAAYAYSGADAGAAGSPGVLSGNTLQLPVHVPVNVCGNTMSVAGVLNPAAGNHCANTSGDTSAAGASTAARSGSAGPAAARSGHGSGSVTSGGATAAGETAGSPGVLSGDGLQLPVDLPVNVSGNSVDVVGVGNPATGNTSVNHSGDHPAPGAERPTPRPVTPPQHHPAPHTPRQQTVMSLAHTGADLDLPAAVGSAALILGGAALYRRFRPQTEH
ncbi:chaplin [Streptomyces sp. NPDC014801]|uniref:chaplin n=1 Tax=Streptomyces sp. NPDC014801 TaxID=3364916 RepID=UPI0036FAAA6E